MWNPARNSPPTVTRLTSFAMIGMTCTVAFTLLYSWLRTFGDPLEANAGALSLTMVFNFIANRRFTFNAHQQPVWPQLAGFLIVYLVGMGASTAALFVCLHVFSQPGPRLETFLALASGGVATVVRFVLLSSWVFTGPSVSLTAQSPGLPLSAPAKGNDSR
jgi:putative flippase GtrA